VTNCTCFANRTFSDPTQKRFCLLDRERSRIA